MNQYVLLLSDFVSNLFFSIVFYVFEGERLFDSLTETMSIFYMTGIITDSWVENVMKRVLS